MPRQLHLYQQVPDPKLCPRQQQLLLQQQQQPLNNPGTYASTPSMPHLTPEPRLQQYNNSPLILPDTEGGGTTVDATPGIGAVIVNAVPVECTVASILDPSQQLCDPKVQSVSPMPVPMPVPMPIVTAIPAEDSSVVEAEANRLRVLGHFATLHESIITRGIGEYLDAPTVLNLGPAPSVFVFPLYFVLQIPSFPPLVARHHRLDSQSM